MLSRLRSILQEIVHFAYRVVRFSGYSNEKSRELAIIKSNLKILGLVQAEKIYSNVSSVTVSDAPQDMQVRSSVCKQSDFETGWFIYWCRKLKLEPILHRKIWEYAYVLQALHQAGLLRPGNRAIGFGCGQEPIASYLASLGITVVVTDLPLEKSKNLGWIESGQHASSLDSAFISDLISRNDFDNFVSIEYVDMNSLPSSLNDSFDFCWSICALEHLGSISNGLKFIKNSAAVLKSNGYSVHTMEYNIQDGDTLDNNQTVLFQEKHLRSLDEELKEIGCAMLPFDSNIGSEFLDGFIDLPPYNFDFDNPCSVAHLKLSIEGYPATCAGVIFHKISKV